MLLKMKWIALFGALSATVAMADQVTLKNGDHLTGTVVKSDGKVLVLHTEFAGDVTIQFSAITEIKTEQELHVSTSDKTTVVGPVTTSDGKLEVATRTSGTVEVPKENVVLIRNQAEQAAYDKSLHPGWWHGWKSGASIGFALVGGNSETESLSLAFNGTHQTLNDKLTMYANSVYTKNNAPGANPSTIANLAQGGIRYDRNVSPRLFSFIAADFMSNAPQALNLRSAASLGMGFHAIKGERTTFDLLAGGNYAHESYASSVNAGVVTPGFIRNLGGMTLGEEFARKLGGSTALTEKLYFYPDLSDAGQYRATFDFGLITKLNRWLGWHNSLGDIFVTNPPPGKKTNDVVFTTGLTVSFTH